VFAGISPTTFPVAGLNDCSAVPFVVVFFAIG
jgi:hypothetical protein